MADDTSITAVPPALVSPIPQDPVAKIGTDDEAALGVRKIKPIQTAVLALGLCVLFWAVVIAVLIDLTAS